MFRVGMKVVCIAGDDGLDGDEWEPADNGPDVNEVCTVSNIYIADGDLMLELLEYPSPETRGFFAGFGAASFRPVVERKTTIEIFQRMLLPSNEPQRKVERTVPVSSE
jgi:hypothetical protein